METKEMFELLLQRMDRMENGIRGDMKSMEDGIRGDMKSMEDGIRKDMKSMDDGIRKDMKSMEDGIRKDMKSMDVRLGRLEDKLELVYKQTGFLTEEQTKMKKDIEQIKGTLKFVVHKGAETERDIYELKQKVDNN